MILMAILIIIALGSLSAQIIIEKRSKEELDELSRFSKTIGGIYEHIVDGHSFEEAVIHRIESEERKIKWAKERNASIRLLIPEPRSDHVKRALSLIELAKEKGAPIADVLRDIHEGLDGAKAIKTIRSETLKAITFSFLFFTMVFTPIILGFTNSLFSSDDAGGLVSIRVQVALFCGAASGICMGFIGIVRQKLMNHLVGLPGAVSLSIVLFELSYGLGKEVLPSLPL